MKMLRWAGGVKSDLLMTDLKPEMAQDRQEWHGGVALGVPTISHQWLLVAVVHTATTSR